MDVSEAMESDYINADFVRESPSKKCVILDEGKFSEGEWQGKKFTRFELTVEIDGKKKIWKPNKDTVKNIASVHGKDSKAWVGQVVILRILKTNGKDVVTGLPIQPALN